MVAGGVGVTLLPEISLRVEARAHRHLSLIPFRSKKIGRTIGLAFRPSTLRKAEFQALAEALLAGLRKSRRD